MGYIRANAGSRQAGGAAVKSILESVLEIAENYDGSVFRAVYTVRFEEAVYVLHCLQEKSKSGISTPKQEIDLVKARLKEAEREHEEWKAKNR